MSVPSFHVAQTLNQLKFAVPLLELMKIEDHINVTMSMVANTLRSSSVDKKGDGGHKHKERGGEVSEIQNETIKTHVVYLGITIAKCSSQVDSFILRCLLIISW